MSLGGGISDDGELGHTVAKRHLIPGTGARSLVWLFPDAWISLGGMRCPGTRLGYPCPSSPKGENGFLGGH